MEQSVSLLDLIFAGSIRQYELSWKPCWTRFRAPGSKSPQPRVGGDQRLGPMRRTLTISTASPLSRRGLIREKRLNPCYGWRWRSVAIAGR